MAQRIRVGAVNYLNTKPLIEKLSDFAPTIELSLDWPSRLADQLARGTGVAHAAAQKQVLAKVRR